MRTTGQSRFLAQLSPVMCACLVLLVIPAPSSRAATSQMTPPYQASWADSTCYAYDSAAHCEDHAAADKETGRLDIRGAVGLAGSSGQSGYGAAWASAGVEPVHTLVRPAKKVRYTVNLDLLGAQASAGSLDPSDPGWAYVDFWAFAYHEDCACFDVAWIPLVETPDGQAAAPAGPRTLTFELINGDQALPPGTVNVLTGLDGYVGQNNLHGERCYPVDPSVPREPCHPTTGAATGMFTGSGTVSSIDVSVFYLPAKPTELISTPVSRTEVDLAWKDDADDETGYKVERTSSGSNQWQPVSGAAPLPSNTTSFRDVGLAPGTSYTYRIVAINGNGVSRSDTASVTTIANNSPQAGIQGDDSVKEGQTKTFVALGTDADKDAMEYEWTIFSGEATIVDGADAHEVQVFFPDGPQEIGLHMIVSDGFDQTGATRLVEVANTAPVPTITGPTVPEIGKAATYSYSITDAGTDAQAVTTSCGSGSKANEQETGTAGAFTCTFSDSEETDVTVTSVDEDGMVGTKELRVHPSVESPPPPTNHPPTVAIRGDDSAQEGRILDVSADATDPDADSLTYSWSVVSGDASIVGSTQDAQAKVFLLDGPQDVVLEVAVSDGTTETIERHTVGVENVAPLVSVSGPTSAEVGSSVSYEYVISDPGIDEYIVETSCGTGNRSNESAISGGGSFDCTFETAGETTVWVNATDSDGGAGREELTVATWAPPPPTAEENAPPTAAFTSSCSNATCSFDGSSSTDADGNINLYAWDFGDGTTAVGTTTSHTFAGSGTYNVRLAVTDDDGATSYVTHSVSVALPSSSGSGGSGTTPTSEPTPSPTPPPTSAPAPPDPNEAPEDDVEGTSIFRSAVTLRHAEERDLFRGRVTSPGDRCVSGRTVKLFKQRVGRDRLVQTTRTRDDGRWRLQAEGRPGSYIARVAAVTHEDDHTLIRCARAASGPVVVRAT